MTFHLNFDSISKLEKLLVFFTDYILKSFNKLVIIEMKGREIMTRRFGFTLAEVLITLGIIGVVAAMTIPTLMNQTSNAEFKTGFKKIVSGLNQAVTMNVALDSTDFSALGAGLTTSAYSMLNSRMNVVVATSSALSTMGTPFNTSSNYTLFFNDGMAVTFPAAAANCATNNAVAVPAATTCRMVVDVNGAKRPNALSTAFNETTKAGIKDQFVLDFFNQQVLPHDSKARYVIYN